MDSFLRENMVVRIAVTVFVIFLALFFVAKTIGAFKGIGTIGNDAPAVNTITVSGKGEVIAVPDIAQFTFGVTEEASTVAAAQKKATDKMNAIIAELKKLGVAEKDIKTSGYYINPRYEYSKETRAIYPPYPPEGQRIIAGYEINHTLEVKLRKIDDAGKVVAAVGSKGAANIQGPFLMVDKEDDIRKEARTKAIESARQDAENLAKSLGVKITRIVSFSENGYPIYFGREAFGKGGADMAQSVPPSIPELPPGENKIVTNVTITYEIR